MRTVYGFFGVLIVALSAASGSYAAATMTNNAWIHVDKVYDGVVTNDTHWGRGYFPVAGERLQFVGIQTNYTVSFPSDVCITNPANFYLNAYNGYKTVIDGSGAFWAISGSDDGTEVHGNEPFCVLGGGYGLMSLTLSLAKAYTNAVAELSDFRLEVEGSDASPRLVVDGGVYDFRDPLDSDAYAGATDATRPLLCLGQAKTAETAVVVFRNGAALRAWDVGLQACATMNTVTFDGASGYFETLKMPNGSVEYNNNYANRSDLILTNGSVISANSILFGHRANKDVRLFLSGEGTKLDVRGPFTGANTSRMSVLDIKDGATLSVGGTWTMTSGGGTNFTTIADGHLVLRGDNIEFGSVDASKVQQQLCRLVATGGSVSFINSDPNNPFKVDGNTSIWTSNTTWNLSSMYLGNKGNGGKPSFEMHGGCVSVTNTFAIGKSDSSTFTVNGGGLTAWGYVQIGGNSGSTGVLNVVSGFLTNNFKKVETPANEATCMYLGYAAGSYGELNISGGDVSLYNLYAGWLNHGKVNLSGGKLSIRGEFRLGNGRTTDGVEDVMIVSGGEFDLAGVAKIGHVSPSHARLKLSGGVIRANGAVCGGNAAAANDGAGWAAFEADGGTIAPKKACTVLEKFDEAIINEGGLTIDTQGFDLVISQDLTGDGVLTLTGGGKVTFDSAKTCGVTVKVVGGTTVDFNGVSPAGLVMGDDDAGSGVLCLTVGETLAVTGDVVLVDFTLSVSGSVEKHVDYAPFITCTGEFDEASREKWAQSLLYDSISSDMSEVFSWSESDGVTGLTVKAVDKIVNLIEVKEGVSNITWDVSSRRTENLEIAVSNRAQCAVSGTLSRGRLCKTGPGLLELSASDNLFAGGFDFAGGLLRIVSPGAFGDGAQTELSSFGSGTLEIASEAGSVVLAHSSVLSPDPATNATVFKTEGNLTLPLPTGIMSGAVIKRGAGCLEFTCGWDGNEKVQWSQGHMHTTGSYDFPRTQEPVAFDDVQGAPPENAVYGMINVVEGELALRGTGADTKATFTAAPIFIGYPSATHSAAAAQPALVLDNACAYFGGTHLVLGTSIVGVNDWVTEPKIVVTNGAALAVNTLRLVGMNSNNPECSPLLYVDGGTVDAYYRFEPNQSNYALSKPRGIFVDSNLYAPWTELRKPSSMVFTNSVVCKDMSGSGAVFTSMRICEANYVHDWRFCDGSRLYLSAVTLADGISPNKQLVFTFDDSEWIPETLSESFAGTYPDDALTVVSQGRGLVLSPDEGESWTFDLDLNGEGGFVKRGEGTVVFDGSHALHSGRTVVESGVLDLGGSTWTGRRFGGGDGEFSNGVLQSARIVLDVEDDGESWTAQSTPVFSDCAFSGIVRVDLGRDAADALSLPYRSLAVARYTGTAPDVSKWRLVGTGIRRTQGTFTASDGVVYVQAREANMFTVIVR